MRSVCLAVVVLPLLAASAIADVPATSYYVVKTDDVKKLLPQGGDISQLKVVDLEKITIAQGHFQGTCSLYLKTKHLQFRIKVSEDSITTDGKKVFLHPEAGAYKYALSMYSQEKKRSIFHCTGNVDIGTALSASRNWEQGEYTILFQKVNLKK